MLKRAGCGNVVDSDGRGRLSVQAGCGDAFAVRVTVEARSNVRASIGRSAVHVRLPSAMPPVERERALARMLEWAERTVKRRGIAPRPSYPTPRTGERVSLAGVLRTLRVEESPRRTASARLEGPVIRLALPRGLAAAERSRAATLAVSRCLAREGLAEMRAMVDAANARCFRVAVGAVRLRYLRASWGSCSRRGVLTFSTRLLLAPSGVREYVVVHELAHLLERGHTAAFWRLVDRADHRRREHALWLRSHGDKLWL